MGNPHPLTDIVQVRRNHNFDVSGCIFLDYSRIAPKKFVLWRDDVFEQATVEEDSDTELLYNVVWF